jgi:tRNA(fMet)-specific endonuclease VapC
VAKLSSRAAPVNVSKMLSFDRASIQQFEQLRASYRRLGQNDLKIAAIAIVQNAVLLNRNQKDFALIAELDSEDWSR